MEKTKTEVAKEIINMFVEGSQADYELLAGILVRKEYRKGQRIIDEGTICRDYIYVEKGLVRQFYYKNSHDITEEFSAEGGLLMCIESLYREEPTLLMAEALEPCVVYFFNYKKLVELTDESKTLRTWLRLSLQEDLVESQQKADSWRFETAKEKYARFFRDYPEAAKRASVNHIASYLLMTPETLSRIRGGAI